MSAEGWRGAASSAVLNTLTGQAGARLAGLDTSFSWRSVAANAVAAGISASVTSRLSQSLKLDLGDEVGQFNQDLLGGAVGGVVSLHTRRAAGVDQRVDYGQVAVDAFGNAISNALTGEHSRRAGVERKIALDRAQREALERVLSQATASTGAAGGPLAISDLLGADPDFGSAISKLTGDRGAVPLYSSLIAGFNNGRLDFRLGNSSRQLLTESELLSLRLGFSEYGAGSKTPDPLTTLLAVRPGATEASIRTAIGATTGRTISDDEIGAVISQLRMHEGRAGEPRLLDLTPLVRQATLERVPNLILSESGVVAAMRRLSAAQNGIRNLTSQGAAEAAGRELSIARSALRDAQDSALRRLDATGYTPAREAAGRRLSEQLDLVVALATAIVPVSRGTMVAKGETAWINSLEIRQSQATVSYAKKAGHNLDDIARGFAENPAHPDLTVDVVRMRDGFLTSVDNSRPAVLNATGGGQIQVRLRAFDDPLTASEIDRFTAIRPNGDVRTPSTWGEAAEFRIWKQGDQFMRLYPNGSPFVPKITGAPPDSFWSQFNRYPWQR